MNENMRHILVPNYMRRFRCIGPDCEDTCCQGWTVHIDRETYRKYRNIKDPELAPLIEKGVSRNRSNPNERTYAKIKFDERGLCYLLSENKMCLIHAKKGEGYLSHVCATYPRVCSIINNILEKSVSLSCPEAARVILQNPDGIEFDEAEEPSGNRYILNCTIDTSDVRLKNKPHKFLWEFRVFVITLLQNRTYKLWERLIILGLFCQKAQDYINTDKHDEIPDLISLYNNLIVNDAFKGNLESIPSSIAVQYELLKEITDGRIMNGVSCMQFISCFHDFQEGMGFSEDSKVEEVSAHYSKVYQDYYEPFMGNHEYIYENYLVNHVFKNLFPLSNDNDVFSEYVMLIVRYALIKLYLIGIAGFHKGLTMDIVIKLVYSFSRSVEHDPVFLSKVYQALQKEGFNTMAYMAILIKN